MIYLLRSYTKDKSLLKLGYAKNYKKRLSSYSSHNPGIEEIGTKDGTILDEAKFHLYLHFLGFRLTKKEWYEDKQGVIDAFSIEYEDLDRKLWENREKIFTTRDLKVGGLRKEILLGLYKKYLIVGNIKPLEFLNLPKLDKKYINYQDLVTIRRGMESLGYQVEDSVNGIKVPTSDHPIFKKFTEDFTSFTFFDDKMRCLCDNLINYPEVMNNNKNSLFILVPREYQNYIELLGPEKIKSLGCYEAEIKKFIQNNYLVSTAAKSDIYLSFIIGKRYSLKSIKNSLKELYNKHGILLAPKASDIEKYFDVKEVKVIVDGKYQKGYEILKKKQ